MKYIYILFLFAFSGAELFAQDFNGLKIDSVCMPSVVCITTSKETGSGFVVDKRGYIVTNYHVIKADVYSPENIELEFNNGQTYRCIRIVRMDQMRDLALLQIEKGNYKALPVFDGAVARGSKIAVLGCPAGQKMQFNEGTVSNTEIIYKRTQQVDEGRIQIDASINQGNSGGAIVNRNGQVVAVVHAKLTQVDGNAVVGFNFVIKSEVLLDFLKKESLAIKTDPLLTDSELITNFNPSDKARAEMDDKVIKEQQAEKEIIKAQTEAELAAIREEKKIKEEKAEAERQRIKEHNRNLMYLDKMDKAKREEILKQEAEQQKAILKQEAEQKKAILKQEAEQEKAYSAHEHKTRIQSLDEKKKRRQMALDRDALAVSEAKLMHKRERAAYYEVLPQRFSTRIGLGTTYYLATLGGSNAANFDVNNLGFLGDIMLGYRLDRKGDSRKSRATTLGANLKLGSWNRTIIPRLEQAQNWNSNYNNLRTEHFFVEYGGTLLLRDWFKLEGNFGKQYVYSAQDVFQKRYFNLNMGFVVRFGALELELTGSTLWLQDFEKPTLRANLMLVYHSKWGKW